VPFDPRLSGAFRRWDFTLPTRFRPLPPPAPVLSEAAGPRPEYDYLRPSGATLIPGNAADLLDDAGTALDAMLEAVARARRSVVVEMYHFAADFVGRRFARSLAERAEQGVHVRVLVDAGGCRHTPRSFFGWMRDRGVKVRGVNPIRKVLLHGPAHRWRDHRKLLLVDGTTAFVGGLNLSRDYAATREGGGGWRDAAIRLRGPVVDVLSATVERQWGDAVGSSPSGVRDQAGEVPAMVLESRPVGPGPFAAVFRHAVNRARRRIWIANPYFLPPRSFRKALRRAARRGVDVRLLVPRWSDSPVALRASQHSYAAYLRSGLRIFEWTGPMMHSKAAVVDGLWCTIGSYNIDPLSLLVNRELNVVLLGREAGLRFEEMFETDFARSQEIDAAAWKTRGAWRRFTENLCASFRILL
jgi:cardiolipin synthase